MRKEAKRSGVSWTLADTGHATSKSVNWSRSARRARAACRREKQSGAKQRGARQRRAKQSGAEPSEAKRSRAERSEAKRSEAERSGAERSGAERSGAKRSEAERSGAKRSEAERSRAKRSEAERTGANRSEAEQTKRSRADQSAAERVFLVVGEETLRVGASMRVHDTLARASILRSRHTRHTCKHEYSTDTMFEVASFWVRRIASQADQPGNNCLLTRR